MQQYSIAAKGVSNSPTVYLIFRVYNIDSPWVGLKVYVDPNKMRKNGSLVFTEETWAVTPRDVPI